MAASGRLAAFAGLLLLTLFAPAFAQDDVYLWDFPLAAVAQSGVTTHGVGDVSPHEIARPGTYFDFRNPAWSPDGFTLAFRAQHLSGVAVLLISDADGAPIFPLIPRLRDSGLPFSFSPEGRLLYAEQTAEVRQTDDGLYGPAFELRALDPVPGAQPDVVGTFIYAPGCGGGSHLPADWRYWDEAGFEGNGVVLALTPYGIVHSGDCTGRGLALADPVSGADVMLDAGIHRVKISPDGTRAVGIRDDGLALVDLATREVVALPHDPVFYPDQVAWSAAGDAVFYSVRASGPEKLVWDAADAEALGAATGVDADWMLLDFWLVSIHRIDLATQMDFEPYRGVGYAVGRMIATPDGAGLLFSLTPNMQDWVAAVLDGSLESGFYANAPEVLAYVPTALYYLDFATGDAALLGEDVNMAALNDAIYWELHGDSMRFKD